MRTLILAVATVFLACNGAFAQPPTMQSAKPPTDVGGARARAYIIQNSNIRDGRMRSVDGWIYQTQTGTYFNPRTGVTCNAAPAACF
jgi:hypothetical protein